MLPRTGAISFNNINLELGHLAGALLELGDALNQMSSSGVTDSTDECRGFDGQVWLWGWVDADLTAYSDPDFSFRCTNQATVTTYNGTLYWEIRDGAVVLDSGSHWTGDLTPGGYVDFYPSTSYWGYSVWVSMISASGPWVQQY